jgi:hypothetical protein
VEISLMMAWVLASILLRLPDPERMEWKVDDVAREALVCAPSRPGGFFKEHARKP